MKRIPVTIEEIYSEYESKIYYIALQYLHCDDLAQEACQEVLLGIFQSYEKIVNMIPEKRRKYIYAMTRNISCGIYIKEEKQRAISLETLYDRDLKDVLELDRFLGDYAFGDRVDEYIEKLSKAEQRILILYYKEEISCDRIAQLLGISNDAVRQRIHRARCHLKELMVLKKKA